MTHVMIGVRVKLVGVMYHVQSIVMTNACVEPTYVTLMSTPSRTHARGLAAVTDLYWADIDTEVWH